MFGQRRAVSECIIAGAGGVGEFVEGGRERCSDCGRVSAAAAAAATQQICLIAVLSRGVGVGAPTDEQ